MDQICPIKMNQNIETRWNFKLETHEEEKKAEEDVEVFIPEGPNFLDEKLTDEMVLYLFEFLDPVSLGKIGKLSKRYLKIIGNPLLFKKFCVKLYKTIPPLPKTTPFKKIQHALN